MKTRDALILTALAALLAASGCSSTADYSPTGHGRRRGPRRSRRAVGRRWQRRSRRRARASSCGDTSGPVDPTALIDDMEATGPPILMVGGRNGAWWAGGDARVAGRQDRPEWRRLFRGDPGRRPLRQPARHARHRSGIHRLVAAERVDALRLGRRGGPGTAPLRRAHPNRAHLLGPDRRHLGGPGSPVGQRQVHAPGRGPLRRLGVGDDHHRLLRQLRGGSRRRSSQTWTQYRIPFGGLGQRNFGLREATAGYQQHLHDSVRLLPQRDLRLLAGRHLFLLIRPAGIVWR